MDSDSILTESGRNKSMKEEKDTSKKQTVSLSNTAILALAGGALALSFGLAMSRKRRSWATFVGQWVPTILLLGVYDNMMKTNTSGKTENQKLLH